MPVHCNAEQGLLQGATAPSLLGDARTAKKHDLISYEKPYHKEHYRWMLSLIMKKK